MRLRATVRYAPLRFVRRHLLTSTYELMRMSHISHRRALVWQIGARASACLWLFCGAAVGWGQAKTPDIKFAAVRTSAAGIHAYVSEKWGLLHVSLNNARDESRELLCTTYFEGLPNIQFGRRVRLPARSRLHLSQPVLIPKLTVDQPDSINFHTLLLDANSSSEVLHRNDSGQLLHDGAVLVTQNELTTAMVYEPNSNKDQTFNDVYELIVACRRHQNQTRRITYLSDPILPEDEWSLQALDHLIIAGNRLADDARALAAVRHWLHGGGRVWVMLDRTDPHLLEMLLGDEFRCHAFDRIGLTTVQIVPRAAERTNHIQSPTDYEVPIDLVRVAVTNAEVTHTVNGWPAAFWRSYGDGQLVVTTLGARAWMRPRTASESTLRQRREDEPPQESPFVILPVMGDLADLMMTPRPVELLPKTALESQVGEYIGYSIPSRSWIVGLLVGLLLLLAVAGVGLSRAGLTEHLGWIGPLLAIFVSAGLLWIGHSSRHAVVDTIATVQHLQPLPGTDDVRVQGVVAAYRSEGSETPIQSRQGGRLIPDKTRLDGTVRRMVWTDEDNWTWENVTQPPGQQVTGFSSSTTTAEPIRARATLNANGVAGTIMGVLGVTDAVLTTRRGRLGVTMTSGNSFVAAADDVFEAGQFLGAGLLGDEQDRRRRTLEKLLNNPQRRDYPARPMLLAWLDRPASPIDFGDDLQTRGAALLSIPLDLERPPNGTEFVIPSPLLPYRNTNSPDGAPSSAMWSHLQQKWQDRRAPSTSWLRFLIPTELLPLEANRARMVVQVTGPVGRIDLLGLDGVKPRTIQTIMDPVGTLSFEVSDPRLLTVSDNGDVVLGINAGDPDRPELTETKSGLETKINYWRIESLSLQLWAKAQEKP